MEATEFGFELKALNPKIKGVLKVHTIASIGKWSLTFSPILGQFFSAIMLVLMEKEGIIDLLT